MKLSEKAQILLERYLLAVEHRLPLQGRKDMIAEIEANLLDTLEDQYTTEEMLTESQLEAELRKLGSPKSVAAGYRTTDALIGPQHNAIFNIIVTIVTPIVVAVTFFATLLSFVISGGESPFWSIWGLFGTAWQVAVGIIGTAAIVFMILTRYFPQVNQNNEFTKEFLDDEKTSWKVSDLPQTVRKEDKLQPWEPIAGIVFGSIWLAVFVLLFDQLVGFWWMTNNQWHMVPIFTETFKAYLPWMGVNIALGIILNAILLYSRRRTLVSRWFEVVVKISEIGLVGALLSAGELVKFDPALAIERGFPASGVEGMQTLFQFNFVHWFLIFLLVVMGIELIKKVIDAVKASAETAGISK